jgi:gluconokinase
MRRDTQAIVVMGVAGAGKSTVGRLLAEALRAQFTDGDALHPAANIRRMAAAKPLRDSDRKPWLEAVGRTLAPGADRTTRVVACSALKRSYRDIIRVHVPDAFFVLLEGPLETIQSRVAARNHEFMPPSLLLSQFQTLERLQPDEHGMSADVQQSPAEIVESILRGTHGPGSALFATGRQRDRVGLAPGNLPSQQHR